MSTSRGTWRRRSRSSSALLLAALVVTACGASQPKPKASSVDDRLGIVFSRMTGKEWSTWIAEADGSNPRVLVNGISGNLSPGGRWFVYAGTTDRPHLFVRDLASGKTRDLGRTWTHAWSPDGSKVAVSNGKQLLLVDPRGGESQELARGKIWFVSFSPDGKAIV